MPQQPISPSFLMISMGNFSSALQLFDEWPNFHLHELPDGVANQFLVIFERKIHRVVYEEILATVLAGSLC